MRKNKINLIKFLTIILLTPILFLSCKAKDSGIAPSIFDELYGVEITPSAVSLAVGNQITFTAKGGNGLYSYSIESGSGSILNTTGAFTASGTPGTAIVKVADTNGKSATATVTVVAGIQISPATQSLSKNATQQFTVSGGVSPYTYSLASGIGSIDASTGLYAAPNSAGSAVIRVTDFLGNTSDANVSVFSALGISPSVTSTTVNNNLTFSAAGGQAPYSYSLASGSGVVNATTGVYTAPASAGSATVRVTDSAGATSLAIVTIYDSLQISPISQSMLINQQLTFNATGGDGNYAYSIVSGTGVLDQFSGVFTAPGSSGVTVVRVTDGLGNTSDSTLTITSQLFISPTTYLMSVNNTHTFTASGGMAPYSYSLTSGVGSINSSTGLYSAGSSTGTAVVRVTDSLGAFVESSVTVNPALVISPNAPTTSTTLGTVYFAATGGVAPYVFSVQSGLGIINSSTGEFTAGTVAGTSIIAVTDSIGNVATANVTVVTGLGINPAGVTIAANSTFTFTGLNGVAPYTFSIVSGGGTINASTGLYTAPASSGTAVIRITDSISDTATANVTINPALQITPSSATLAVNNTLTFTSTGGVSPYTYSIVSGGGTIDSSTGLFTAPAVAGSITVQVTDSRSATSNSIITVNSALSLTSNRSVISLVDTASFSAAGGVSPYSYSVLSGPGSINSTSGLYTPTTAGSVTVRVIDAMNNTATVSITVNSNLAISPTTAYVVTDSDFSLIGTGGVPPYTYSVTGVGSIDSSTGIYTAPSSAGSATITVTDSLSHTANSSITVYGALTLSPTLLTIAINGTQTFVATGGVGSLSFAVYDGDGDIDPSTGLYTAPGSNGVDLVRVYDTIGNYVEATINVASSLTISPATLKLPVFSTATFTSILGTSPYVYSVESGSGTVDSGTGVYTASATLDSNVVRSTDAASSTSDATVTHISPVEVKSGFYHTCVRYNEGSVKCFGDNAYGQLGIGSTSDMGDVSTEVGGALNFVNLGTGRTAKALAAGIYHSCAILDNDSVKCWGYNAYGQLGIGSTSSRGDAAGEMGDNLPVVNLGSGRTAKKIFAFGYVTCVIMDNDATKCFGRNNYGQLGLGDITNRGTTTAQMNSLATVNFGTSRTAVDISGGIDYTCVLLDNASVKCFGRNNYGQLGIGNTNTIGDAAGEMGDSLAAVNLGTGRTVTQLSSGYVHSCAILDNAAIKCWGRNNTGQLGIGNTSTIGDGAGEMGDSMVSVPLASFTATKIVSARQWTCALNSSNAVRCWGQNTYGQLLRGNTSHMGDNAGEIASLTNLSFGTAVVPSSLSLGYYFGCAILDNNRIKCWGRAANGALLNASTTSNLGDSAGELGDSLPYVNH